MRIVQITLHIVEMPLKTPFITHLETVKNREAIVVEVQTAAGATGYGEVVAFSTPWYTEETVLTCFHMLKDVLIPRIINKEIQHPSVINSWFQSIRRNEMAKSGLETAIWDAYAKEQDQPLWAIIGGEREEILSGAVVGASKEKEIVQQIEEFTAQGYSRIKIKYGPNQSPHILDKIREGFPDLMIMVDANSAFTLKDVDKLKLLDQYELTMIEQPLAVDDLVEHSLLQKEMKTPICLDESIVSVQNLKNAIHLQSLRVLNIKLARIGGYTNAIQMHDLCIQHNIQMWCGGMIEFGISRAHNLALATLPGFNLPGDISSSSRYWEKDIINPEIIVENGKVKRLNGVGIGVEVNQKRLIEVTTHKEFFTT